MSGSDSVEGVRKVKEAICQMREKVGCLIKTWVCNKKEDLDDEIDNSYEIHQKVRLVVQ